MRGKWVRREKRGRWVKRDKGGRQVRREKGGRWVRRGGELLGSRALLRWACESSNVRVVGRCMK